MPRVGGLGLIVGLLIAGLVSYLTNGNSYPPPFTLLVCALPVFLAGFVEDLTKSVSVRTRLLSSFVSAALAVWLLGAQLPMSTPRPGRPAARSPSLQPCSPSLPWAASPTRSTSLTGSTAWPVVQCASCWPGWPHWPGCSGDSVVMKLCLSGMAAMLGFMLLNYPFGKIFLGDGGAYLAGFWLAECAVLLLVRNPEVSTWTVLLCCLYPVLETAYSMLPPPRHPQGAQRPARHGPPAANCSTSGCT